MKRQFNSTDVTLFGPVVQRIERVTSNLQIQVRFLTGLQIISSGTHTAVRWAKLDTIPRSWE